MALVGAHLLGDQSINPKQLAARVGAAVAVAVAVHGQLGIVAIEPAGAGLNAIGVVVEEDGLAASGEGFDAVAGEVDGERVSAGRGDVGAVVALHGD